MIKLEQIKDIKKFDSINFKQKRPFKTSQLISFNELQKTQMNLRQFFNTKSYFLSAQLKKQQKKRKSLPHIEETQKNISQFFSDKHSRRKLSKWTRIKTIDQNRSINQQLSIQKIKSNSTSFSPVKIFAKNEQSPSQRKHKRPKYKKIIFIQSPQRIQTKLQIAFENQLILNKQKQSSIRDNFPICIKFKKKVFPRIKNQLINQSAYQYYSPWDVDFNVQLEQFST